MSGGKSIDKRTQRENVKANAEASIVICIHRFPVFKAIFLDEAAFFEVSPYQQLLPTSHANQVSAFLMKPGFAGINAPFPPIFENRLRLAPAPEKQVMVSGHYR